MVRESTKGLEVQMNGTTARPVVPPTPVELFSPGDLVQASLILRGVFENGVLRVQGELVGIRRATVLHRRY